MLHDARGEARDLLVDLGAVDELAAQADGRGALDGHVHADDREAALLEHVHLIGDRLDHGVDDRSRLAVAIVAVDEHAQRPADLRGGEPDADGVVHEGHHVRAERDQVGVEVLDLDGLGAQHGIAELGDLLERALAAGALLGREFVALGLLRRFLGLVLVGHSSIVAVRLARRAALLGPRRHRPAERWVRGVRAPRAPVPRRHVAHGAYTVDEEGSSSPDESPVATRLHQASRLSGGRGCSPERH